MKIQTYISTITDLPIDIRLTDKAGFKIAPFKDKYIMNVPKARQKLTFFTKATVRHEIGHIIFDKLYHNRRSRLDDIMFGIKRKRMFCALQRFYYWNSVLRWVKRKLKFCGVLWYTADEIYKEGYTRQDNELFCDWFAVYGLEERI